MQDELPGVPRLIGGTVDYADGAEEELLGVIAGAGDRSSRSDELATHVHDWPTKYHMSRLRSNLLRPLNITEDMRIVDVGAGTGAIARYLGEQGASILAVEGSEARARVAAQRCHDIENVEVVAGEIAALEVAEPFDMAVVVGVLEYAAAPARGPDAGIRFLTQVASLVAHHGALVLAIENKLGLKYLLGLPEDHLGEPGVGVEGYSTDAVAQTFSRRRLAAMLGEVGLSSHRWLFPFPDYKLPTAILGDSLYELEDAGLIIDQLIRRPVAAHDDESIPWMDSRRVHLSFVEAGLGPDVANSFLVVAGRDDMAIDRFLRRDELAWLYGDERRSVWSRDRALVRRDSGLSVELRSGRHHKEQWLNRAVDDRVPFEVGRSMEQLAVEACRAGDLGLLSAVLARWLDAINSNDVVMHEGETHPFSPIDQESALPGMYLDINLDNFIERDEQGSGIAFIDTEWSASGPVSLPLVAYRALWYLARRMIDERGRHIWQPGITVGELAIELGALARVDTSNSLRERFLTAESQFQELVGGGKASLLANHIERLSSASVQRREETMRQLRVENEHRLRVIGELQAENEHRLRVIGELQAENEHRLRTIEELLDIRKVLDAEIEHLRSVVAQTQEAVDVEHSARLQLEETIRSSPLASFALRRRLP